MPDKCAQGDKSQRIFIMSDCLLYISNFLFYFIFLKSRMSSDKSVFTYISLDGVVMGM